MPEEGPWSRWRDRLDALPFEPSQVAAAVGALLVLLVAGVAWVVSSWRSGDGPPVEDLLPRVAAPSTTTVDQLVVHVAGAVATPGVHVLAPRSRVGDAVRAAGGLLQDADADRLNLAAPLSDGERIFVPRRGQADPMPASEVQVGPRPPSPPLDLNSATAEQLDALPGVGPATAKAIVDHRTRHGRFRSVDQLLEVRGIGPAKLAELRARVRV